MIRSEKRTKFLKRTKKAGGNITSAFFNAFMADFYLFCHKKIWHEICVKIL